GVCVALIALCSLAGPIPQACHCLNDVVAAHPERLERVQRFLKRVGRYADRVRRPAYILRKRRKIFGELIDRSAVGRSSGSPGSESRSDGLADSFGAGRYIVKRLLCLPGKLIRRHRRLLGGASKLTAIPADPVF